MPIAPGILHRSVQEHPRRRGALRGGKGRAAAEDALAVEAAQGMRVFNQMRMRRAGSKLRFARTPPKWRRTTPPAPRCPRCRHTSKIPSPRWRRRTRLRPGSTAGCPTDPDVLILPHILPCESEGGDAARAVVYTRQWGEGAHIPAGGSRGCMCAHPQQRRQWERNERERECKHKESP